MKLTPATLPERNHFYKCTKIQMILEEFISTGIPCMSVSFEEYTSGSRGAQAALNNGIKRMHLEGIKAIIISGDLYLIDVQKVSLHLKEEE